MVKKKEECREKRFEQYLFRKHLVLHSDCVTVVFSGTKLSTCWQPVSGIRRETEFPFTFSRVRSTEVGGISRVTIRVAITAFQ